MCIGFSTVNAQVNCDELMTQVEYLGSESKMTYSSSSSTVISKVSFYNITADYKTTYWAIVCIKNDGNGCTKYIYKVNSQTRSNYAMNYRNSAGKAFWKYINPHSINLKCSPSID